MRRAASSIDGLNERQRAAVHLLAQGKTIREVARFVGVSEKTIYNYRQKTVVQNAIYKAQSEMLEAAGGRSLGSTPAAMLCLEEIINNPEARDADRIAASRALLGSANSFAERRILERQIYDLEQALGSFLRADPTEDASIEDDDLDPLLPSANPEDDE